MTGRPAPLVSYPDVPYAGGVAAWFRDADGAISETRGAAAAFNLRKAATGTYAWYAAVVWHNADPTNMEYWLSNLGSDKFRVE